MATGVAGNPSPGAPGGKPIAAIGPGAETAGIAAQLGVFGPMRAYRAAGAVRRRRGPIADHAAALAPAPSCARTSAAATGGHTLFPAFSICAVFVSGFPRNMGAIS